MEARKAEEEIKKILSEISKQRSTSGQLTSDKHQDSHLISWYDVGRCNILKVLAVAN